MKKTTKKMLKELAKELAKAIIVAAAAVLGITLQSCGVTSARISRPAEGTTTTVTITTNNPMSTTVNPNTNAEIQWKNKGGKE